MLKSDRIAEPWGHRTPYDAGEVWPQRRDQYLTESDVDRWVRSASVLQSNGDALDIAVKDGRVVGVRGRAGDRVNRGRLDPKDLFGWQSTRSRDRLTTPLIRAGAELVETDWDTAMGRIVERSRQLLGEPGGWDRFGFYTSGGLFLEEYYTLALIGKAGIGTPHMDGDTRLCTATAAAALMAGFGSEGQPGSYEDIDRCDAIALWGHNAAETQAVLWMRMLDRRDGLNPPAMLAVDPRPTAVALEADVHLAPRTGTNLALMNAILREVIHRGWIDEEYVAEHTIGFEDLVSTVEAYTPERVADICDVAAATIERAAELVGACEGLVSTVSQGFYQSHQATASACQVNNLHLLRGMLGRPGAGVLQMSGQPAAQNIRETGADGQLPGLRNWSNPDHIAELARLWKVPAGTIPRGSPSSHAMQIFRYAETGGLGLLWISGANPAVSMPEPARVRRTLGSPDLFVVVQDIFRTETSEFADVVLPAAAWGEKPGTFTNSDRTVHLSEKAVEPPGEARSDLDIFLDYARRMDFRIVEGDPLIRWKDPESAFEAWKACSAGRPCDYTGLTYARLRGSSGIQWPCTPDAPDGTPRLYSDGVFATDPAVAVTYGRDLASQPAGRAFLRAFEYEPAPEAVSDAYPMLLTTGATVYHSQTRAMTGRAPQLDSAAPDVWVEIGAADAERFGIQEGDLVRIASARGSIEARARITRVREGVVFVPFHYGHMAAGELAACSVDPVSKQPMAEVAAVSVTKVADADGAVSPAPTVGAATPLTRSVPLTVGGPAAEADSEMADSRMGAARLGVEG